MEYSEYQLKIFDFIKNKNGNAIIEAVAGSGKTTTVVTSLEMIPPTKRAVFLAFNVHIAEHLKTKVPKGVDVMTLHSLGRRILVQNKFITFDNKADSLKVFRIVDAVLQSKNTSQGIPFQSQFIRKEDKANLRKFKSSIVKIVEKLKSSMILPNSPSFSKEVMHLIDFYEIELAGFLNKNPTSMQFSEEELISIVKNTYLQSSLQKSIINFDDMIFMPSLYNLKPSKLYDYVFVDEVQDLNKCQSHLLRNILSTTGRIIVVGDTNQAIMGFAGANTESMKYLSEMFSAQSLELSICYRCPKSHISLAQTIVPRIKARENAPEGIIEDINTSQAVHLAQDKDLIICRNNSPLISMCLKFISSGRKANIRGTDLATTLISLIEDFNVRNIEDLRESLIIWKKKEVENCKDFNINPQPIIDRYECIMCLINESGASTSIELIQTIKHIFSDENGSGVTLSSIHKAKGLEANSVFILQPHLMPSIYATKDWEMEQEKNLMYVAYTRSKNALYFIHSEKIQ
jgi:DNA helicase-2/ATP-dependent DNA helicase PcrA